MPNNNLLKASPVLLAAWALTVPQQVRAQTAIIDNGAALATIYVDAKAPSPVTIAATDLQTHLQKMTGVKLPIVSDASKLKGYVIYLGDTAAARKQGIQVDKLPSDGFRILSNRDWMIIAGKDYGGPVMTGFTNPFRINESYNTRLKIGAFGNAGTLFGVYHFLETYGVRWYMPGPLGTVVPTKSKVVVPPMNLRKAPFYPQRHAYYNFMELSDDETLWYRRAGYGSPAPVLVMHSFGPFFHKYKDTNPEFFAIIDGKRDFTNLSTAENEGNYNLSDPGLIKQAIADANKWFDDNPDQLIFPLCPSDGMTRISEDPVSQAQIDKSQGPAGEFSNYVWGFVNKVAKGIQEKHPDKFIGCFAYEKYSKPPTNIDKLEPNVVLVITKMRARYSTGTFKKDAEEKIAAWSKKASVIYTWEYYCNPLFNQAWKGYPMFFTRLLQDDLKSLKGISRGEFIEAESWTPDAHANAPDKIRINYPGVDHLLLYLTARLLWNPDLDVKALLSEYYKLFYGPAEKPMRAFWEGIDDNWHKKGWQNSPSQVYSTAFSNQLMSYLQEAKAKTAEGSPYRQRVELIFSEFSPAAKISARIAQLPKPSLEVPRLGPPAAGAPMHLPALSPGGPLMSFLDRRGETASPATNAQVSWDDANIYVDVRCYEPEMGKLKTLATKRDSAKPAIWEDDSVEIFLSPDAAQPQKSVHYIVSASGALFDSKAEILNQEKINWDGKAKASVRKEANRWIVRLTVPWTDLGLQNVQAGHKLAANFYRSRFAGGELSESGWAPMPNSAYYSPQDFGTLILGDKPATPTAGVNPLVIQPATTKDYGSGAGFLGLYYEGGIPNVGLYLGHANPSPRGDRALMKFDLRPLLEAGEIKKADLTFAVFTVSGKLKERNLDVRYFPTNVDTLDADILGNDETESLGQVTVKLDDAFYLTSAAQTAPVRYKVDATALIKDAIAKGRTSMVFRWQDVLAEKQPPERDAVGVGLSETGTGGLPALEVTVK